MLRATKMTSTILLLAVATLALAQPQAPPALLAPAPPAGPGIMPLPIETTPPHLSATAQDEQKLRAAGLLVEGPALVEFFRLRAQLEVDAEGLSAWIRRLGDDDPDVRTRAARMLLGRGTTALPVLRRARNDLGDPELASRLERCIALIEGEGSTVLPASAARLLAHRKPAGAVEALLGYLPAAETPTVVDEVAGALAALAYSTGKPHPALLAALEDDAPMRRAVAGSALCSRDHPETRPAVRKLLRDPRPLVRLRVGLALAEVEELEAFPVLIELLAEVSVPQQRPIEALLHRLAGDWGPNPPQGDDPIAQRIRRDAWAGWWRNTDGPALLAELRRRTLSQAHQEKVLALVERLGDEQFEARQRASGELTGIGVLAVPLLREATRNSDAERARRAEECLNEIADKGVKPLPEATLRLLALRRPPGALEAILDYLPFADNETLLTEARKALASLAIRDGRLEPALPRALEDKLPVRRLIAAEALLDGGGLDQRDAVRKLLRDAVPQVRMRIALALAIRRDREAFPVLIESLAEEPSDWTGEIEEMLYQLAGESGPKVGQGSDTAGRRKHRDAWAAWWKQVGPTIDLGVLQSQQRLLGFTLLAEGTDGGRVLELGRDGKPRWVISGVRFAVDAHILPGNRVLIAEYSGNRVTERDFKGNILWQKDGLPTNPVNVQRLANGNTFIATTNEMLEVDRAGKTVWSRPYPNLLAAYRSPDGVITCLGNNGQCVRISSAGKELKMFPSGSISYSSGIDGTPSGRLLISRSGEGVVAEVDTEGKVHWQAPAAGLTTATRLTNGHTLVASMELKMVSELDRTGKVVWTHQDGIAVFRARRR